MTIKAWLLILTLAVGAGISMSSESTSSSCPAGRVCRIGNNCWINGEWRTPCPDSDPSPEPSPETELP